MNDHAAGRIITFYSYKGGTGRSMALANVAWLLAMARQRVLAVDWDLEAPGLHRYFHPFHHDPELRSTRGIMDMIWDFTAMVMSPESDGDTDWFDRMTSIAPYAVSLDWPFPGDGTIDLVCSGRHDATYSRKLSSFDWDNFYESHNGADFIDALGENMRSSYDWILIDSRTGLSDTAGICTVGLPDTVVNCFTLNTQSIEGAAAVARSIEAQKKIRRIALLPVPMRVEDGEQKKLELGRDLARATFDQYLHDLSGAEKDRYWGDVEVPYKPFYAYEEILAVFGDRPFQEGTLLAAYERLTTYLTDREIHTFRPMEERVRRRALAVFERTVAPIPTEIVVSHVASDRSWADWISVELTGVGFAVSLEQVSDLGQSLDPALVYLPDRGFDLLGDGDDAGTPAPTGPIRMFRTVALVSSAYLATEAARKRWRAAVSDDPDGLGGPLLPVRIEDFQLPAEFAGRAYTDLVGLDEGPARQTLLARAGRPLRPAARLSPRATDAGAVRFPGSPPQVWRGVPERNPSFIGREALLLRLRDRYLGADGRPANVQVLQGLAGVGKTQLAVEYVFRFGASYDLVCWIGCDQVDLVRSSLTRLATDLRLPEQADREMSDEVINALRRGEPFRRWLLIFDNADAPDDVTALIPPGPGHVLVTSRNQRWRGRYEQVEVGMFSREESITLLQRRAPALTSEVATQLAEALGDLPLALEHAGAWHAETGMAPERYLELLHDSPRPLLLEGEIPTYSGPVATTWLLSMDRLRSQLPMAARLAELCAFFGPDPISLELFNGEGLELLADPVDEEFRDPLVLSAAVRQISEHALVHIDHRNQRLAMHRLVQAVIRDSLPLDRREQVRHRVHALLAAADPGESRLPENWPRHAMIRPHLVPSGAVRCTHRRVATLVIHQVQWLYEQRDHTGCQSLASTTLDIWQGLFGDNDERTLTLALDLADSLRAQGFAERARGLDQPAFDRLSRIFGSNHQLTLRAGRALGGDLRGLGEYQEALRQDENTYARYRDVGSLDDQGAIMLANNIAVSLRLTGEFRLALEIGEDVYTRQRRTVGENAIYALQSADSHARDLRECGRYRESVDLLLDTLTRCRRVLGDNHPDTLRSLRNYATSLRRAGQLRAAWHTSQEALQKFQALVGENSSESIAAAIGLVNDLCLTGDPVGARRLAEKTHRRAKRRLGADSLYTHAAANALMVATRGSGEPTAAAAVGEPTVARLRALLPDGHPFSSYCAANLANCRYDADEAAVARTLDEEAAARLRDRLGDDHPNTLLVNANLAVDLAATGEPGTAETLRTSVLASLAESIGADHPLVGAVGRGERVDLEIDPPPP
ncbi:FxSxx-COOH system tetratricopeptide repeat protein [Frankia sp. R82]|uniref:FxSxx-COOH system tetratricopeptide repeat protein n=1 Tax=Frankia sp. R82 TaxID=2950553 RepID=UPI002043B21D|nr:FxSxx-COOH system tetratricopeptide repeat protein [Frankia sp. R82]MCM3882069.1 FxSxx-COOH system tetratricopeptide repeat protein [Frankia sp. R82]